MGSNRAFIILKEPPIMKQIFATQLQIHNLSLQFKTEELDNFYPGACPTTMSEDAGTCPD